MLYHIKVKVKGGFCITKLYPFGRQEYQILSFSMKRLLKIDTDVTCAHLINHRSLISNRKQTKNQLFLLELHAGIMQSASGPDL